MTEYKLPYAKDVLLDGWTDAPEYLICCHCANTHFVQYRQHEGKLQVKFIYDEQTTWHNRKRQLGEPTAKLITNLLKKTAYDTNQY